jgi:hypothetical protein
VVGLQLLQTDDVGLVLGQPIEKVVQAAAHVVDVEGRDLHVRALGVAFRSKLWRRPPVILAERRSYGLAHDLGAGGQTGQGRKARLQISRERGDHPHARRILVTQDADETDHEIQVGVLQPLQLALQPNQTPCVARRIVGNRPLDVCPHRPKARGEPGVHRRRQKGRELLRHVGDL